MTTLSPEGKEVGHTLNNREVAFLLRLKHNGDAGVCIDRAEDRARQRCRRLGLAFFDRAKWLWRITPEGIAALRLAKGEAT